MITDSGRLEALQKLPALKGPALSIVVALMIAQRPLQATELQTFTGYSNQAITAGLRTLRHFQAVVNLGHGTGYQLASIWRQMMLPIQFADHEIHDQAQHNPQVIHREDHENHDQGGKNGQVDHENHDQRPHHGGGSGLNHDPDVSPPPPPWGRQRHENHDRPVDPSASGEITPSRAAPEITARSGSPEITAVAYWLNLAGVDPGSHNWGKIIALGQQPEYVKAHVLELLASQEGFTADEIGTGALIYRLTHRWGAPPMRCEKCLHLERECRCEGRTASQIPDEYRDIIKR